MLLYVTTGEPTDRKVTPLRSVPETVSRLYLDAMRDHDRKAVVRHRAGPRWIDTPDWRFDRHVIRTALYLVERWGLRPGDRIGVLSQARPEALLVELAAAGIGAVHVPLDPGLSAGDLAACLRESAPRAAFASDAEAMERLLEARGSVPPLERLCVFEASAQPLEDVMPLSALLDYGATLDTPERADAFRRRARGLEPADLLTLLYRPVPDGPPAGIALTHGDVMAALRRVFDALPAQKGDTGCVLLPPWSLTGRLARLAFVGDGYTTLVFPGGGSRLWDDLREIRPAKIAATPALLAEALERAREAGGREGVRALERALARLPAREEGRPGPLSRLLRARPRSSRRLRRLALAPLGGDVRWITTDPAAGEPVSRVLATCGVPPARWFGIPELAMVLGGQRAERALQALAEPCAGESN